MNKKWKKITPTGDLSWYIKWTACICLLVAVVFRSIEEAPKIYDVWFSYFGTFGWFFVGMMWKDRALIFLNASLSSLLLVSLIRYYFF